MSGPLGAIVAIALGYLLGALPFGVIAGRLARGVDLRQHGSRRTGATNALRTLGLPWAVSVLVLDVAKGAAAVLVARLIVAGGAEVEWIAAGAGLAAVIGHNWSAFIGFRGGRGVATTGGGLLAISPLVVLLVLPVVLLVIWGTRYVSAGSLAGAVAAPLIAALLVAPDVNGWPAVGYALGAGLLVIASHRDNIARLRAGTERRIGERDKVDANAGG